VYMRDGHILIDAPNVSAYSSAAIKHARQSRSYSPAHWNTASNADSLDFHNNSSAHHFSTDQ